MTDQVRDYLLDLQNRLCRAVQVWDESARFREDRWQRPGGGGGITRVTSEGARMEKGGVNFSEVTGEALPSSATAQRPHLAGRAFTALGVSLVFHPRNPYVPTTHFNLRYFEAAGGDGLEPVWWFGGGYDLTPYYYYPEDEAHWHQQARQACEPFGEEIYPLFRRQCDEYFFLPHRNEYRGLGGLFFDDWNQPDFDTSFALVCAVGDSFAGAWFPLAEKRADQPYGERERDFQAHRRGRYVEFNLLYDRGSKFGLSSGGRTESILMSLPPYVRWTYDFQPEPGSPEEALVRRLSRPLAQ